MSDELEENFMSHTEGVAVSHNEVYLAYVKAGFSEEQALDLLKVMISTQMRNVQE